jgi:hypothetical protein
MIAPDIHYLVCRQSMGVRGFCQSYRSDDKA